MGIVRTNCYIIGKGGGGSGTADLPTHLENLTIITSNQCATLTLSYSNTDFVTGVRVCYKRNSYPTNPTDGDYVEVNEVAEMVKITGLTNLITYYFRVFLYRIVDDTTYFQTVVSIDNVTIEARPHQS